MKLFHMIFVVLLLFPAATSAVPVNVDTSDWTVSIDLQNLSVKVLPYLLSNDVYLDKYHSLLPGTPEDVFFEKIGYVGRAFTVGSNIYYNRDATWYDDRELQLTLQHEIEHTKGKDHSIVGIMSPFSFVRYVTVWE